MFRIYSHRVRPKQYAMQGEMLNVLYDPEYHKDFEAIAKSAGDSVLFGLV